MPDDLSIALDGARVIADRGNGLRRHIDAVLIKAFVVGAGQSLRGRLRLQLPSGRKVVLGSTGGVDADLMIVSYGAIWNSLRRGLVGFADSYLAGQIQTQNLNALFDFYLDNEAALEGSLTGLARVSRQDRRYHESRDNTRTGSRRNIEAHYDLGNAFYRLWLDPNLSYSSAIYARATMTLEEAQAEKHRRIIEALRIQPGQRVFEIGCGWGSVAEAVALSGGHVTAITISREQHEAAAARIRHAGLEDRATILFQDYRDSDGQYDRVVSIEMIEAVGERHWPTYFETLARRLVPGGSAIVQAITLRADLIDSYRQRPDFIQRYVFPGGMLPTVPLMSQHSEDAGLVFEEIERFGHSYARTLADWRERFDEAWPRIEALGFDDTFRRLWTYYLCYCEVGFQRGLIDVGLYRLSKPAEG